jgi:uncharacterized protein
MRLRPELKFDAAAAAQLACPACRGDLRAQATSLVCAACGRVYPIRDGIPVLIRERAEGAAEEESQAGGE